MFDAKELSIIRVFLARTSQQNCWGERKHRHLVKTAKAIIVHADLPLQFWDACVLAATHIINKLSMAIFGWQTRFKKLFGKSPGYFELKVIGSLVTILTLR